MLKLKAIICIIFSILLLINHTSAQNSSQLLQKKLSIEFNSTTVTDALKIIEQKLSVRFMYNSQLLNKSTITYSFKNATLIQILETIINNSSLVFYEYKGYIVITEKSKVEKGTKYYVAKKSVQTSSKPIEYTAVHDTIKVYDTLVYTDTIFTTLVDTIIQVKTVYDTVKIIEKPKTQNQKKYFSYQLNFSHSSTEIFPTYINNKTFTNSYNILLHYNTPQAMYGFGVGTSFTKGLQSFKSNTTHVDSVLHNETYYDEQLIEIGRYYYIDINKDTIHVVLYDTLKIEVPYSYYSYHSTEKLLNIEETFSVTHIQIPFMYGAKIHLDKKQSIVLSGTLILNMNVMYGGKYFNSQLQTFERIHELNISRIGFSGTICPQYTYSFKNASLFIGPFIQYSFTNIWHKQNTKLFDVGIKYGVNYKF